MIDTTKNIRIYDDTGSGDDFDVSKILYNDEDTILCLVSNVWHDRPLKVLINKITKTVSHDELHFYCAKNL